MDFEAQQHLKDHLFHGVYKHIYNSVWYLWSTHGTSYLQLMVATWKAESKNEETKEKVRARATVTTDPGEGTGELGQQIAKLMATLTQTGQSSSPSSVPGSPQECGHRQGHSGRSTLSHPNSHNGRGSPGQAAPACRLLFDHRVEGTGSWGSDQGNHGPSIREEGVASH